MKTGGKRAVWQILNGERLQMFESIEEELLTISKLAE